MIDIVALIMILITVYRLFAAFRKHISIYSEFAQSTQIRYLILLCVIPPILLLLSVFFVSWYLVVLAISVGLFAPAWIMARKQYQFFDVQGTARVRRVQEWLSQVQTLSILGWVYLALHGVMVLVPLIIGSSQ
jgi:hypothetical protein